MSDGTIRDFGHWLREQRDGGLHDDATIALNALARAVVETGKGGEIAIVVRIKPTDGDGLVVVSDEVKTKLPQQPRAEMAFVDEDGNLSRHNPHQESLPLEVFGVVGSGRQEVEA